MNEILICWATNN